MRVEELTAYELTGRHPLPDLNSEGLLLRHKKTGARVAVITNDDENKVFYIGFRTPPKDSTGVPHIIEHTVLCGSEKYPVKDPFVELVKGSLNTFLNAMTYPDKTIYPVASCNDTDFQNLMDVYLDAVFHPQIYRYEEIFKQEGWHYELADRDAPLTVNGVVYNEMKGAFSSPDDVLQREILNALFPDTVYSKESGGDPDHIPELTYEQYLAFHRTYYHPSNAYIYLYGNMDVAEKLRWMDEEYLSAYEQIAVDSAIGEQAAPEKPAEVVREYPVASEEPEEDNTYLSYNFVIGSVLDRKLYQAFDVLDYALLDAPGAPLKKALLDAGIGKDIMGGYDNGLLQPTFSVIAKNTNLSEKEQFLAVIRQVLEEQVRGGIDKKALLAGISSSEFKFREADFGQFPKGLLYGIQCLDSWIYDDLQPFLHLDAIEIYQFLKEQVDTGYFEQLVERYLLNNPHAAFVAAVPKRGLNAVKEKALAEGLAAYKAGLTEEELDALIADTKHLKEYQEEPSPKEALEKIPMLGREDLRKKTLPLQNDVKAVEDVTVVHHNMHANGIVYLALLFDIRDLLPEELPYLGILKSVLGFVDTEEFSYAEFANEVNIHTGGIGSSVGIYPDVHEPDQVKLCYEVRVKALAHKMPEAAGLLRQMLLTSVISDEKRLYEILAQLRSRMQAGLSSAGHSVASMRAMSYFSRAAACQDATGGIACFRVVQDYEEHFEEKKEELIRILSGLIQKIFTTDRLLVSVTCEQKHYGNAADAVRTIREALPAAGKAAESPAHPLGSDVQAKGPCGKNEGFMDASQVQYVARAGNFVAHGYRYHGALRILKVILGYDYLWINLRVKGGAYGCMNGYMRNGDAYFVSYRDPNLSATNEVYDGIPEYLEEFDADEHEMTKYVIGTVSDMDAPLNPSAKGARSMAAYLQGISYEELQRERDEVLCATAEDIRGLKDLVASVLSDNHICVIGNEDCLRQEKEMFGTLENLFHPAAE